LVTAPRQEGSSEGSYDPMRQFSELAGDVRDPYPMLAGIRASTPVMQISLRAPTGRLDANTPAMTSCCSIALPTQASGMPSVPTGAWCRRR